MLTAEAIAKARAETVYSAAAILPGHDDCVRMAYQWLDAQVKTKGACGRSFPIKHIVEEWAGRYVSQSDVEVAAHLHPEVSGTYPRFTISSKLNWPLRSRLAGIGDAASRGSMQFAIFYARDEAASL